MTDADASKEPIGQEASEQASEPKANPPQGNGSVARAPAIIVTIIVAAIVGLSL